MKIYILMATYNGEKYLRAQIDSILSQSYQNWQLIIHDDNSIDATVDIIKDYVSKYPEQIIYINDDIATGGAKENFAYILKKIDENYHYVMFCDQDDIWLNNKIEVTLQKMIELEDKYTNKPILIHTNLYVYENRSGEEIIYPTKKKYKLNQLNKLFLHNVVTGCTMMLNKQGVKVIGDIPDEAEMHDWWIALIISGLGEIGFVENPTIMYRQHEFNVVGMKKRNLYYYIKNFKKIFYPIDLSMNLLQIRKYSETFYIALSQEKKELLDILVSLPKYSNLKVKILMFKYKIFWPNFFINILFILRKIKF